MKYAILVAMLVGQYILLGPVFQWYDRLDTSRFFPGLNFTASTLVSNVIQAIIGSSMLILWATLALTGLFISLSMTYPTVVLCYAIMLIAIPLVCGFWAALKKARATKSVFD